VPEMPLSIVTITIRLEISPTRFSGCSTIPRNDKGWGYTGADALSSELAWKYSVKNLIAAYDRAFEKRGDYTATHAVAET